MKPFHPKCGLPNSLNNRSFSNHLGYFLLLQRAHILGVWVNKSKYYEQIVGYSSGVYGDFQR